MTMYFFWHYDSYLTLIKSDQVRGPKLDTYPVFFFVSDLGLNGHVGRHLTSTPL